MSERRWRILIADDEPAARLGVRQHLAAHEDFMVIGECRNGSQVLAALEELRPDVLFLDIRMPGMGGFEVLLRRRKHRLPIVVFLTAYSQFALRAFEAEALDYLLKPASEARFADTMRRVRHRLETSVPEPKPLVVTTALGTVLIPIREIEWIEAAGSYVKVWTARRSYLLREPLRALERRIRANGFARAHRGALVRIDAIRELAKHNTDGLIAVLGSGQRIPISRRRRGEFTKAVRAH